MKFEHLFYRELLTKEKGMFSKIILHWQFLYACRSCMNFIEISFQEF